MVGRQVALQAAQALLGVSPDADAGAVTRAYRHHARRLHPDLNPDADAATRFLALHAAYRLSLKAARDRADVVSGPSSRERNTPTAAFVAEPVAGLVSQLDLRPRARTTGAWLVAGPVHVQPPRAPYPTTHLDGRQR